MKWDPNNPGGVDPWGGYPWEGILEGQPEGPPVDSLALAKQALWEKWVKDANLRPKWKFPADSLEDYREFDAKFRNIINTHRQAAPTPGRTAPGGYATMGSVTR